MAVSKAWTIKTGIKDSVNYISNEEKTSIVNTLGKQKGNEVFDYIKNETKTIYGDKILVSGHFCNPQTAESEFQVREAAYHAKKKENIAKGIVPNQAVHVIQSFSAKDSVKLDPDKLHELGKEFAGRICGEHFQAVIASHLNHPEQLHNHIIINAYALDGPYKFIEDRACLKRIREINDELCKEYGLEVIVPEKLERVANFKEWEEKQNGTSWKEAIREDIKTSSSVTDNWYDYTTYLKNAGYTITEYEKSVSYCPPGHNRSVRDVRLGTAYTRTKLLELWEERQKAAPEKKDQILLSDEKERERELIPLYTEEGKKIAKEKLSEISVSPITPSGRKRGDLEILLLRVIKKLKFLKRFDPDANIDKQEYEGPLHGKVDWKIQNMIDTLILLRENEVQTQEDLTERINDVGKDRNTLRVKLDSDNILIQNMEQTLQELDDFYMLEEVMDTLHLDSSLLNVEMPDRETLLTARAEQDPMTNKQKMELFKLLEDNVNYRLDVRFTQISRTDAIDIIDFLKGNQTEQPPLVITAVEFEQKREKARENGAVEKRSSNVSTKMKKIPMSIKEEKAVEKLLKDHPSIQLKYPIKSRYDASQIMDYFKNGGAYPEAFKSAKDVEIEKLSEEDQTAVKSYLAIKEKLYNLGLTDMEKIQAYREELKERTNTFAKQKEEFKDMGRTYAKLKRMEYNVILAKDPAYSQSRTKEKVEPTTEQDLPNDNSVDQEIEKVAKQNIHNYRNEDKNFHYDEER